MSRSTTCSPETIMVSDSNRSLPNLFLVGSMKCGTTSLHNYLGAHPQIFMTGEPWKEPAYFVERLNWSKGEELVPRPVCRGR